jgi:hypothetical protein
MAIKVASRSTGRMDIWRLRFGRVSAITILPGVASGRRLIILSLRRALFLDDDDDNDWNDAHTGTGRRTNEKKAQCHSSVKHGPPVHSSQPTNNSSRPEH